MSTLNNKIEEIIAGIGALNIEEDDGLILAQRLRALKGKGLGVKLKPLEHYDGKSRPLRSWLTEANLHMENNGITEERAKIIFIGSHLKDDAWNWFEPFRRERDNKPEVEWSDRTTKVLRDYAELTKAMGQVFGDIDERKTAAIKLQQLRQTGSVRQYITEFQTITANLEWDEEALSDKFEEGLKPKIRGAMVYYTKEPEDLEELFERAQRIDREIWNQERHQNREKSYNNYGRGATRFYGKQRNQTRFDRQGDVIMTGAKVSMTDAKKTTGSCYNCGIKGHYARECRHKKKTPGQPRTTPQDGNRIRMVRMEELTSITVADPTTRESGTHSEEESEDGSSVKEEVEKEQLDVSTLFQGLTEQDFSSDESSSDDDTEAVDWEKIQTQMEGNEGSLESIKRIQTWIEGWRLSDGHVRSRNQSDHQSSETSENDEYIRKDDMHSQQNETGIEISECIENQGGDSLMKGHSPKGIQGSSLSFREELKADNTFPTLSRGFTRLQERLNDVNFSELTHRNPVWKDFCGKRTTDTVKEYQEWYSRMNAKNRFCKCYGFESTCWSESGKTWMKHIKECRQCEEWSKRECGVPGHSVASKRTTLMDVSERKFTPEGLRNNTKKLCCVKELCTHEFWTHGKIDVPWWTCYNETCAEHYAMKAKNGGKPKLPKVTILNNDNCPCLRKRCICGFDQRHQLHRELVTMRQCPDDKCTQHEIETTDIYDIDQEVSIFRKEIQNATKEIQGLMGKIITIRKISNEGPTRQMETKIKVNDKIETAIIDSGADINYANEGWCSQNGIDYEVTGYGKVKAYDGSFVQEYIRKATVEFEIQGTTQRQVFHILKETGDDSIVLGMPWLEGENPAIDWKTKRITIRRKSPELSTVTGNEEKTFARRSVVSENGSQKIGITPKTKGDPISAGRGGYNSDSRRIGRASLDSTHSSPDRQEKEYERNMQEVLTKLPKELWKFREVFCKRK